MSSVAAVPANLHLVSGSDSQTASRRPDSPIKVVLAIDHAVVRRSLRLLVDSDKEIELSAEATELSTAIGLVRARDPHVLVVDLRLAVGSNGDTIRRLRAEMPGTEVVVLTMEDSPLSAQQALDAGAAGFVLKDRADSELLPAIHCAAHGDEFVSSRVVAGLNALRRAVGGDGLSPRETEVVRLIALGHTSAEIAGMLGLSRRTVETQRARVYKKLGVTTRAQLVRYALKRHLIGD